MVIHKSFNPVQIPTGNSPNGLGKRHSASSGRLRIFTLVQDTGFFIPKTSEAEFFNRIEHKIPDRKL
jgi:hypothetical protein